MARLSREERRIRANDARDPPHRRLRDVRPHRYGHAPDRRARRHPRRPLLRWMPARRIPCGRRR
ncbi:hypothetical protein IOD13_10395 [Brevibacterium casei]|nr:hypothetical protein [Brevibacterium casei]